MENFLRPILPQRVLNLPEGKKYFRIAETSALLGVEQHSLRAWESEFPSIRPEKHGGQRVYRKKDVDQLELVRHMLHEEGYTLKAARAAFRERRKIQEMPPEVASLVQHDMERTLILEELDSGLKDLLRLTLQG